jgi:glycosyltransferase involved in cell wall biosynthesis
VFVFAGVQQEGQPLVVLEAMAAGLPIVFTDRGCLRETVVNGVTGCEVRVNDPNDLSRTLLWLFDHPEERQRMGQAARRRYETLYTLDRHVKRMTDVFARTLQEAG